MWIATLRLCEAGVSGLATVGRLAMGHGGRSESWISAVFWPSAPRRGQGDEPEVAGGRLALDNEPLTLQHVLPPPLVLFGIVREGCLWRS